MSGEYDWLTLDDDEEILWDGEISQKSMIGTYVVGIPLILLLGLGLLIIVPSYLIVKHTDYVITSKGVYKRPVSSAALSPRLNTRRSRTRPFRGASGPVLQVRRRRHQHGRRVRRRDEAPGRGRPPGCPEAPLAARQARTGARGQEDSAETDDVFDEILVELRAIRELVEARGGDGRGQTDGPRRTNGPDDR